MKFGPLERVACALCGEQDLKPVVTDEWFGEEFHVVRCGRCELMFTNPRPAPEWKKRFYDPKVNVYLQQDGRDFCYQRKDQNAAAKVPLWRYLQAQVPPGCKLLDVGCSSGEFAKMALDHGFAVAGFDLSPGGPAHARKQYGIDAIAADVEHIAIADDSYDVITLIQVFEHFKDPIRALTELQRILKPGGLLYVETVNYLKLYWLERYLAFLKPLYFRVRRTDSPWWKDRLPWVPFDHYYHWAPRPLIAAFRKVGFDDVENHYFSGYDQWKPVDGGGAFLKNTYRSAIDLLFRATGKQIAGTLIVTGRKPAR